MFSVLYSIRNKYSRLNKITKASIWFIAVTLIDKAIGVLTQPFVNRILSVEEVGAFGFGKS